MERTKSAAFLVAALAQACTATTGGPRPAALADPLLPALGWPGGSMPRLERRSFMGAITMRPVYYNVYFPAGYDDHPGTRYPVVYRLHGRTDSRDTRDALITGDLEAAIKANIMCPAIIVFPDGM